MPLKVEEWLQRERNVQLRSEKIPMVQRFDVVSKSFWKKKEGIARPECLCFLFKWIFCQRIFLTNQNGSKYNKMKLERCPNS
jgi:hypothetical protein